MNTQTGPIIIDRDTEMPAPERVGPSGRLLMWLLTGLFVIASVVVGTVLVVAFAAALLYARIVIAAGAVVERRRARNRQGRSARQAAPLRAQSAVIPA